MGKLSNAVSVGHIVYWRYTAVFRQYDNYMIEILINTGRRLFN